MTDGAAATTQPPEAEPESPAADERHQQTRETTGVEPGAAGADRQRAGAEIEAPVGDLVARRLEGEAEPRGGDEASACSATGNHDHQGTDAERRRR